MRPSHQAQKRGVRRLLRCGSGASVLALMGILVVGLPRTSATQESRYLTGKLLVAMPEMPDPRFAQTVIYIVKHDKSGAMGLVVNRPIAKGPISDLLKSLGVETKGAQGEIILHYGGPVDPGRGFTLHSDDYKLDSTTVVQDGIALTIDNQILRAISLGKGPRRSLIVLGYAGWSPGQLEGEIEANAWFSIPAEEELIFGRNAETKWERALDKRKIEL